jgi:hypothetical protein
MASGANSFKQTNGYFVPLKNLLSLSTLQQYTGGAGAGGSFQPGSFTKADWAVVGGAGGVVDSLSSIGGGGLLKDMGKTVVSSNRTFRKVQLVTPATNAAGAGAAGTSGPYLTGYLELAAGSSKDAVPAPVAYLPGLL